MNEEQYALVPIEELKKLKKDSLLLDVLRYGGVDNWEGYSIALDEYVTEMNVNNLILCSSFDELSEVIVDSEIYSYLLLDKNMSKTYHQERLDRWILWRILPIIFYDNEDAYYDEVGGFHQEKEDYDCNPFGVQCVNCTRISCTKCERRYIKDE